MTLLLLAPTLAGCADAPPDCGPRERLGGQLSTAPESAGDPLVTLWAYNDHPERDATFCVRVHPGGTYALTVDAQPGGHALREMATGRLNGTLLRVEAWVAGTDLREAREWDLQPENHVIVRYTGQETLEVTHAATRPVVA